MLINIIFYITSCLSLRSVLQCSLFLICVLIGTVRTNRWTYPMYLVTPTRVIYWQAYHCISLSATHNNVFFNCAVVLFHAQNSEGPCCRALRADTYPPCLSVHLKTNGTHMRTSASCVVVLTYLFIYICSLTELSQAFHVSYVITCTHHINPWTGV